MEMFSDYNIVEIQAGLPKKETLSSLLPIKRRHSLIFQEMFVEVIWRTELTFLLRKYKNKHKHIRQPCILYKSSTHNTDKGDLALNQAIGIF